MVLAILPDRTHLTRTASRQEERSVDLTRRSVALCATGVQAEFERRLDDARALYAEAWRVASDDYDRCVAAHYVAHLVVDPSEALRWNLIALESAQRAEPGSVAALLPSLYVSLGRSYEMVGDTAGSDHFYAIAAEHGLVHRPDPSP
jgi:hypothetical protein